MQLICRGQTKFFPPSPKLRQRRRKFGSCFGAQKTAPAPLPNHGFKGRRQSFRSTVNLWETFCKADMFAKQRIPNFIIHPHPPTPLYPPCVSLSTYAAVRGFAYLYPLMLKCVGLCVWWRYDDDWHDVCHEWHDDPAQKCKQVAVLPRRNMNRRPSIYKPWFYDS